jgi:hypothetical protein
MEHRFTIHYTRDEARALLPQLTLWLDELLRVRTELESLDAKLAGMLGVGDDLGGTMVNRWVKLLARIHEIIHQFNEREIQIKDLDRGLIDFPAFVGGREVFLCWEKGEDDVEFWHDFESGYGGREKL